MNMPSIRMKALCLLTLHLARLEAWGHLRCGAREARCAIPWGSRAGGVKFTSFLTLRLRNALQLNVFHQLKVIPRLGISNHD